MVNVVKSPKTKFHIFYFSAILILIFAMIWFAFNQTGKSIAAKLHENSMEFEDGWYDEEDNSVDLSKLKNIENTEPYKEFSVYNTLPETLNGLTSLCFRSKNIFYAVYVDGNLVYQPQVPESVIYTDSFGTRWSCVQLDKSYAGKTIEIRITKVYENSRTSIDNISIGSSGGIFLNVISERLSAFITCILLIFVGIILMLADIPASILAKKDHELLYLGLFAIAVSIWCLTETNLLQLYFDDSRFIQVVSCYSLMLIPMPLFMYLDAAFGFKNKNTVYVLCGTSAFFIILSWVLHFMKIKDIHSTLILTHIMLLVSAISIIYAFVRYTREKGRKFARNPYYILKVFGLFSVSAATVIDTIRYYKGFSNDSAMFVRMGFLIFIICYGCSSLEKIINAVKAGTEANFIRQLAYSDGLTKVGNRTAFQEKIQEVESSGDNLDNVGIVMFDVNNLKVVNDTLGHSIGDEMIKTCARCISDAFAPVDGKCYRIGGDEFAVVLNHENVKDIFDDSIEKFKKFVDEYNNQKDKAFTLSVAYGYSGCVGYKSERILYDTYKRADKIMYENKKIMKMNQNNSINIINQVNA
jgi:diguanylate cyclase (GGDEF)-like protein